MLLVESALKGYAIEASDGAIGIVSDFLFDDSTWVVRWLVVDAGTWLTERKVLIHPSAIGGVSHERRELAVTLTVEQVKASPDIHQDQPVSRQMEYNLYDHYGWDPLWGGTLFGGDLMASRLVPAFPYDGGGAVEVGQEVDARDEDPHLRSTADVAGYHILANDGEIGHVENFLIDDTNWRVRYLIVDTKNWWPGQHVLLSPRSVKEIDGADRLVHVDVTRDQVKGCPPWDPVSLLDEPYEKRLHDYYGWATF
jgi:hypothetical protein